MGSINKRWKFACKMQKVMDRKEESIEYKLEVLIIDYHQNLTLFDLQSWRRVDKQIEI